LKKNRIVRAGKNFSGQKRSGFFLFVTKKYADKTRETIPLYIIPVLKVAVQEKGTVLKERILPGRI
jgi:hypothetical protein